MDFSKLKRDPNYFRKSVLDTKKDGAVFVKEEVRVYLLTKLEDYVLLTLSAEMISTIGSFIMVSNGKFCIMNVAGIIELAPTSSSIENVGDEVFYEFTYAKGAKLMLNKNIVKVGEVSYYLLDRYLFRGGCPSYLNALDRVNIYLSYKKFNGVAIDSSMAVLDMLVSMSLRSKKDVEIELRHSGLSDEECQSVALANVVHGKVSVINKVSGSYQKAGLISALNTDIKILSPVEKVVRA